MGSLSGPLWAIFAVLAGLTAMGILQVLASAIQRETFIHDLRVRVANLRLEQLAKLRGQTNASLGAPPTSPQSASHRHAA